MKLFDFVRNCSIISTLDSGNFSKVFLFICGSWYFCFRIFIVFKREGDYYKQWCLCNRILGYLRWYCQLKIGSRCLCWITNWLRSGEKGWKELKLGLDELKSRPWAYHEIWSHHQHVTPSIESQYFTDCNFFQILSHNWTMLNWMILPRNLQFSR